DAQVPGNRIRPRDPGSEEPGPGSSGCVLPARTPRGAHVRPGRGRVPTRTPVPRPAGGAFRPAGDARTPAAGDPGGGRGARPGRRLGLQRVAGIAVAEADG